jgi:hypothetical protein
MRLWATPVLFSAGGALGRGDEALDARRTAWFDAGATRSVDLDGRASPSPSVA